MSGCDLDTDVSSLIDSLKKNEGVVTGLDLTFSDLDFAPDSTVIDDIDKLSTPVNISDVSNKDLTGSYDVLSDASWEKLQKVLQENDVSSVDIAKAYIQYLQLAMQTGVQFSLGKDQNLQAILNAKLQLQSQKADLLKTKAEVASILADLKTKSFESLKTQVEMMNLAAQYCTAKYNLEVILPKQAASLDLDNQIKTYNIEHLLPLDKELKEVQIQAANKQILLVEAQISNTEADTLYKQAMAKAAELDAEVKEYTVKNLLPEQLSLLKAQIDVQAQQAASFRVNNYYKIASIHSSIFSTLKSIDEGLTSPIVYTNKNINAVFDALAKQLDIELDLSTTVEDSTTEG